MKLSVLTLLLVHSLTVVPLIAQSNQSQPVASQTTLRINSQAVLVDVLVTDHKGAPVTGLKQDAFTVTEQGKPQTISFFEEHTGAPPLDQAKTPEFPALPPDVFSNFSPIATPPAVNVLLLDALNTPLADQMVVRKAAIRYLKNLKPGLRLAIFTLSTRLRFVQGFADDPAVLAAAMGYRKNAMPVNSPLTPSSQEITESSALDGRSQFGPMNSASPGVAALQDFMSETNAWQLDDREFRTLQALQDLATLLGGFPGRKDLIWLSSSFPLNPYGIAGMPFGRSDTAVDTRFEGPIRDTFAQLATARVSVYPVDARGVMAFEYFTAENNSRRPVGTALLNESMARNIDYATEDLLAEKTGGTAFYSKNDLWNVIDSVVSHSSNFYTFSYTPTNTKMDGSFRDVGVQIAGGQYKLSYRRGYFARIAEPAAAKAKPPTSAQQQGPPAPLATDPFKPYMMLGTPLTQQIVYKALVQPVPAAQDAPDGAKPAAKGPVTRYAIDFSIDLKDLDFTLDEDGIHHGLVNLCLIVYDRYGQVVSRDDRWVTFDTAPEEYADFQDSGVKIHQEIDVPKGQYWLRTGVYDRASHNIGTLEAPLSMVRPLDVAQQ